MTSPANRDRTFIFEKGIDRNLDHQFDTYEMSNEKEAPGIYFSSIVAQELLAGVRSPARKSATASPRHLYSIMKIG
jgi:hypothetical protein